MRLSIVLAIIGLTAAAAAQAQQNLPDPPICNSSLHAWTNVSEDADIAAMRSVLQTTPPSCRNLRSAIQHRIDSLTSHSAPQTAGSAQTAGTTGVTQGAHEGTSATPTQTGSTRTLGGQHDTTSTAPLPDRSPNDECDSVGRCARVEGKPVSDATPPRQRVPSVAGTQWRGHACWSATECIDIEWVFAENGRFTATNIRNARDVGTGSWQQRWNDLQLSYDNRGAVYTGTIEGSIYSGRMRQVSGPSGSFQMSRE